MAQTHFMRKIFLPKRANILTAFALIKVVSFTR